MKPKGSKEEDLKRAAALRNYQEQISDLSTVKFEMFDTGAYRNPEILLSEASPVSFILKRSQL